MMFDLERSGGNILPELEAYLLLLLTGLARLRSREKEMDVMAGMERRLCRPRWSLRCCMFQGIMRRKFWSSRWRGAA